MSTIVGPFHELTAVQLQHQGLVDFTGGEVEGGQILVGGKAGGLDLVGDRPDLTFRGLRLQQLREDRNSGVKGRRSLFREITDRLGHAVHL
jgi:hypothetical protein